MEMSKGGKVHHTVPHVGYRYPFYLVHEDSKQHLAYDEDRAPRIYTRHGDLNRSVLSVHALR